MGHRSDTRFLVLHGLRLKGFGEPPAIAAVVGLDESTVSEHLAKLQVDELVLRRDGRLSGWTLTPAGRTEQQRLAAADLAASGAADQIRATYRGFLALNDGFKVLCTDWQVRDGDIYDRGDAGYNAAILDRLRTMHLRLVDLLRDLAGRVDRYAAYEPRFGAAVQGYERGDLDLLTKPLIDSYHTIWFELHEDLLTGLGIERSQEGELLMGGTFGSVLTAMVTPFDGDGALDLDAAVTIARFLQEQGNDGLVVAGTTGEAPVLGEAEKYDLWRAVSEAVTIPVVAGTGTNNTAETIELTRAAAGCGAAGVLVVGPYYNRPPQSGIEAHFRAVAAATDLPVIVYDVPVRTGRRIAADVLLRLFSDVPNVIGFKDATGDPTGSARLVAALGSGVEVYSGDDAYTLPLLAVGAVAVIGVATHWTAPEHVELFAAWDKGDEVGAREINARLLASFEYENSDTCVHAQSAKAALRVLGLPAGECRLPLGPAPEGTEDRARKVLRGLGRDV